MPAGVSSGRKERNTNHFPLGEICANQLLKPSFVICSWLLPSGFMRHICISPLRTELKYMYWPSGVYSGPSSKPLASVSRTSGPLPSAGILYISNSPPLSPQNTMYLPSGLQPCVYDGPVGVICLGLPPVIGTVQVMVVIVVNSVCIDLHRFAGGNIKIVQ
jgi:hypothetical protein